MLDIFVCSLLIAATLYAFIIIIIIIILLTDTVTVCNLRFKTMIFKWLQNELLTQNFCRMFSESERIFLVLCGACRHSSQRN